MIRALGSVAFALVLLLVCGTAEACPMCSQAVAEQGGGGASGMAAGYFWSILFMVSMPFLLLGGFAGVLILAVRSRIPGDATGPSADAIDPAQ